MFGDRFEISQIHHVSSVEGDGVTRYFYEVLMNKPEIEGAAGSLFTLPV